MRFVDDDRVVDPTSGIQMQVIAAGFARCATSSLQAAFENDLGLGPSMHMGHVAPHVDRLKYCVAALLEEDKAKRQAILHKLFDGYAASCDFPGFTFVDDLIEMYPNARVVLNTRKTPEVWQRSITRTLAFFGTDLYYYTCYLIPTDYWHHRVHVTYPTLAKRRWGIEHATYNAELYNAHNAWVRDIAKRAGKDVLEWQPEMGWAPLCEFLGKEVPQKPFPRLNEESFIKKLITFLMIRGVLAWVALLSAPAAAYYAYWWMRN